MLSQRRCGRIRSRIGTKEAKDLVDIARFTFDHAHTVEHDVPFGQRAGLVEAHHIHTSEHLNGRKFLHQTVSAGERDRRKTESNRGDKNEPLGDDGHQAGDDTCNRMSPFAALYSV